MVFVRMATLVAIYADFVYLVFHTEEVLIEEFLESGRPLLTLNCRNVMYLGGSVTEHIQCMNGSKEKKACTPKLFGLRNLRP